MSEYDPPRSKADYVYQVLREEIRASQIAPGEPLRANTIATRLGVSITPVREALRRLEIDRLVVYQAHRGATVADLSDDATREFYDARAAIEGLGAFRAASTITAEQVAELWAIHRQMVDAFERGDLGSLAGLSERIHLRIVEIGGPSFLGAHARGLRNSYPVPPGSSAWLNEELARSHLGAHSRIIRALDEGDGTCARLIMIEHITASADFRLRSRTGIE